MIELQPGDRVVVTSPKAGNLFGQAGVLISENSTHVAVQFASRPRPVELPARWVAPAEEVQTPTPKTDDLSDISSDISSDIDDPRTPYRGGNRPLPMSETVSETVSEIAPKKRPFKAWQTVYRYRSKEQMYYRYAWKDLNGTGIIHIPGGNWRSRLVQERKDQVRRWISEGKPPSWIAAQVKRWGF